MIPKKAIVCDLDGTLAISKSPLSMEMAEVIEKLIPKYIFAVISGGAFAQFEKQFISQLHFDTSFFKNLYIFPTMGGSCYTFDINTHAWKQVYEEGLNKEERESIIAAFEWAIPKSGVDLSKPFGSIIEDRGTQVTFSGRGQNAPPDIKKAWDPDKSKRNKIIKLLKEKIPNFEFHVNGSSSIDVTRIGLDKAHAIDKLEEIAHLVDEDIIFYGDALFSGGNDEPAKRTGVDYVQVADPDETLEILKGYL